MSEYFSESQVLDVFDVLEKGAVRYVLPRNIDDEIPESLPTNKDIDIVVNPSDAELCQQVLVQAGWLKGRHPWDFGSNFNFLYSMNPFQWYSKAGLNLDVAHYLCCRSPNKGEWVPLDQMIQDSVWNNILFEKERPWERRLCSEDELVHLLTRCIFDKKAFSVGYIKRIEVLTETVNYSELEKRLVHVFFRFTPTLLVMLRKRSYDSISSAYFSFRDY